ncbi:hypothetical protein GCM10009776_11720 [Microbacterium deminutum]|uniref:Amidohydrolase 3 domain-containing protein n=1 Tax=Microbacterium deminutum TaxID=344164 RepID=A0ABP5BTD3_9MICO
MGEHGGRLAVGERADLTVFADNPLTTDPDEFAGSPVLLTLVDGAVVVDAASVATASLAAAVTV